MNVCCPGWIPIQVDFSLHVYIEKHGQQNIKFPIFVLRFSV